MLGTLHGALFAEHKIVLHVCNDIFGRDRLATRCVDNGQSSLVVCRGRGDTVLRNYDVVTSRERGECCGDNALVGPIIYIYIYNIILLYSQTNKKLK